MRRLKGIGVSPGTAVGRAVLFMQHPLVLRFSISADRVRDEVARIERAREISRRQLREIRERVAGGPAAECAPLFDAQLMMLDDPTLVGRAIAIVRSERVNAQWALQAAADEISGIFETVEDEYLRERQGEVTDVVGRLRLNLVHGREHGPEMFRDVADASVLVADELTPSMAAQVDWRKIRGFVSDAGSRTYHTAILARSLRVPAVVGLERAAASVPPGALVVVDGTLGEVIIDPPDEIAAEFHAKAAAWADATRADENGWTRPARTLDGTAIRLLANVELPDDLAMARRFGAEGIGLYRSEYLVTAGGPDLPAEETQYAAYRTMLEAMAPEPVTIRTFDVDERQLAESLGTSGHAAAWSAVAGSSGPLGLRAIRLSLARREVFRTQLRAMLRAARYGRLRIILPFVSGVEEAREARAVVREVAADLASHGEAPPEVPIGAMLEVPSAAITADLLAGQVDFFSIGTNDLIQYLLAVDRTDARVSGLYEPLHPAVLRTIRSVVRAARRLEIPVSLCGEMAADPVLLPLLVGLGLTEFSMTPSAIPAARRIVARLRVPQARRAAADALALTTPAEIERALAAFAARIAP